MTTRKPIAHLLPLLLLLGCFALLPACGDNSTPDGDGDVDGDVDGDTDTDADGDSDGDADGDVDGDADSDADSHDADADTPADAEPDGDADSSDPTTNRSLFIGNSYTAANGLHALVGDLLDELGHGTSNRAVTGGGMRLEDHADDADGTDGDTLLRQLLVTGDEAALGWDVVMLQEQSQIPGFPWTEPMWLAMVDGATTLRDLATSTGSDTVLLMTWGRRDGDATNPGLFPDYLTMQDRLAEGYTELARRLGGSGARVAIAPAGEAFRAVYLDGDAAEFAALYSGDGSHPSAAGSYLTACVIVATLTGSTPVGLTSAPASLDAATRVRLQEIAADVVLAPGAPALWRR